jgi:adenosylhomocysteine nucleosidase
MLLRWLVNNYLRDAAQGQLQEVVAQTLRGVQPGAEPTEGAKEAAPPELAPPCDVAFIFALGIESGGLVDKLTGASATKCKTFLEHAGSIQGKEVVIAESGLGAEAAAAATADVIKFHEPAWVVSAGFAGGLADGPKRGDFLMADQVINLKGERLEVGLKLSPEAIAATKRLHVGRLLTVEKLIGTQTEKRKLGEEHQALACDMESFAVAETCRQLKTRFLSVRIISDGVDDQLPKEIERLMKQTTLGAKLGAAAKAVFSRPQSAADMWKLQDEALKASDRLAKFLLSMLPQLVAGPKH